MNPFSYARDIAASLKAVSTETGIPLRDLYGSFLHSYCVCRVQLWEFLLMRLYDYPAYVRRQFLSYRRCVKISNRLIAGATQDDLDCYGKKNVFNKLFADYIRRDWLYVPEASPDDIRAFFRRNEVFLAKEVGSTQGHNISLCRSAELDPDAFIAEYDGRSYVLEAFIRQHPALAALNPTSVNTIRLVTASCGGRTAIIGGCLRTGGVDAYVDNFHSGGVAFPLDLESGIVNGSGRSFDGKRFLRHPATGAVVPGTVIPFWEELTRQVLEAAQRVPPVGYIGWDIAVTPDGPEFIEGNVDIPDHTLIQMDRPDAYGRIVRFLDSCAAGS